MVALGPHHGGKADHASSFDVCIGALSEVRSPRNLEQEVLEIFVVSVLALRGFLGFLVLLAFLDLLNLATALAVAALAALAVLLVVVLLVLLVAVLRHRAREGANNLASNFPNDLFAGLSGM